MILDQKQFFLNLIYLLKYNNSRFYKDESIKLKK